MRLNGVLLGVATFVALGFSANAQTFSTAGDPKGCIPSLEGPVAAGNSKPYTRIPAPPRGYVQEEFYISCNVQGKPYKTLIVVVRPANPADASGVVTVEPIHRAGGWTLFSTLRDYLVRTGGTAIMVASKAAVLNPHVKGDNPARYASLSLPEHPLTDWEVMAQLGAMIKTKGIPGVAMKHLILGGHSDEGSRTRHYILQEHAKARLNGRSVYDGYFPLQAQLSTTFEPLPDTDVPVIEVQGERELIEIFHRGVAKTVAWRRPDGEFYRLYEAPAMGHINTRKLTPAQLADPSRYKPGNRGPATWTCDSKKISPYPRSEIMHAAFDRLVKWIDKKIVPPKSAWIETLNGGRTIVRDEYGTAKGGIRHVYFEVPVAGFRSVNGEYPGNTEGERCDYVGTYNPLSREELLKLYPTHADYVKKFNAALDRLVKDGWYLEDDAKELREEAQNSEIPDKAVSW